MTIISGFPVKGKTDRDLFQRSKALIDEFVDRKVDWLCEHVPPVVKSRTILLSGSAFGWRILLYCRSAAHRVSSALRHIKNEDNMESFMRETEARSEDSVKRLKQFISEQIQAFARLEAWSRSIRFTGMLFLLMVAVLGVAAKGGTGMAIAAASICIMWLSAAIESNYAPIARGVRQRYLAATFLRTGSVGLMMLAYFYYYVVQGVPSNVVLQCAMIITLVIHDLLFLVLVAFNRRQPLFLRALAGVTGVLPALTAAAAWALAASCLFRPWPLPLSGAASALGATLVFMSDQLITITQLGGVRLKLQSIWVCLLMTAGFMLMLLGMWTYTL